MNNWAAVQGSPLLARQNVTRIAGLLFIVGIILLILFAIAAILAVARNHRTAEWAIKKQNKLTNLKNVNAVAQKVKLSREEKNILWEICRIQLVPNIEYLIHSPDKLMDFFRKHYKYITEKNYDSERIYTFFTLLYKLEQEYSNSKEINSSRNIPDKTDLFFTDKYGRKFPLKLLYHDKNVQYVQPSDSFMTLENKPKELDKITLLFVIFENLFYKMPVRVVRYQTATNGVYQMLLTHSPALERLNRRNSKRIETKKKCFFSSVKVEQGKKDGEVEYIPSEKKHEGIINNISGEGCSIITRLPIKAEQNVYLEFSFDPLHTDSGIGVICGTEKNLTNGVYTLHIKFLKMSLEAKNRIFAYVYNFA